MSEAAVETPVASPARLAAWQALEFAVATKAPHQEVYAAVEALMQAAHAEGAEGRPYAPINRSAPPSPPATPDAFSVAPAEGLWMGVMQQRVSPFPEPWVVFRKGDGIDPSSMAWILAICPDKETATKVARALEASGA